MNEKTTIKKPEIKEVSYVSGDEDTTYRKKSLTEEVVDKVIVKRER